MIKTNEPDLLKNQLPQKLNLTKSAEALAFLKQQFSQENQLYL